MATALWLRLMIQPQTCQQHTESNPSFPAVCDPCPPSLLHPHPQPWSCRRHFLPRLSQQLLVGPPACSPHGSLTSHSTAHLTILILYSNKAAVPLPSEESQCPLARPKALPGLPPATLPTWLPPHLCLGPVTLSHPRPPTFPHTAKSRDRWCCLPASPPTPIHPLG